MVNRFHKYRQIRSNDPKRPAAVGKRLFFFVFSISLSASLCLMVDNAQLGLENYLCAQITKPAEQTTRITIPAGTEPPLDLEAKAAYSLRVGVTGREKILYRDNENESYPIASLTKLMTAAIVLENPKIYGLDHSIIISPEASGQYDVPVYGNLFTGESYTVDELLHLMLLYSSNDAAWALSEAMGQAEFVTAMNLKGKELGFARFEFYNSSGLDREDGLTNYASAADLMVLAKYILKNHPEIFDYSIKPGPYMTENGISSLKLWDGNLLVGGKTGFTERAGGCMVVVFRDGGGRQFINIVLGAVSPETRVEQMQKMINFTNNSGNTLARTK